MKNSILLILPAIFFASCFKEDEPLPPYQGNTTTITHEIEQYTSYFDFETNSTVSWHPSDAWDLGFTSGPSDISILTNSGGHWFLHNTGQHDMQAEIEYPLQTVWNYDQQSFFPDSTAASGWISINNSDTAYSGEVYLLGQNAGTSYSTIYRLKFLSVNSSEYSFCYSSNSSPGAIDTIKLVKNPEKGLIHFSFNLGQTVDLEPDVQLYDLIFCPYYAIATEMGISAPYLVRGVLLNPRNTEGLIDSITGYENIDSSMLSGYSFSGRRDVIGFDWKNVIVDTQAGSATYIVKLQNTYIIKTAQGNYYKMRFVSYQLNGENGFPSFEFKSLASPSEF